MPYITKERRDAIWEEWNGYPATEYEPEEEAMAWLYAGKIDTPGELNFAVTKLMQYFVKTIAGENYAGLSATRAAVQDAVDEFYRRKMVPYEDEKIDENGDVY